MLAGLRIALAACAMALPLWVAQLTPGHACTFSMDDSIRLADTIVIGVMGEMTALPREAVADDEALGDRTPVEITFAVEEYIKGSGPNPLRIIQPAAQILYDNGRITGLWTSGTSCGRPVNVGERFVVLLGYDDLGMFSGSGPLDEQYGVQSIDEIRRVVAEQSAPPPTITQFPDTGSRSAARSAPMTYAIAGALGIALACGALLLGRRLR
jgi:hypothetical protein